MRRHLSYSKRSSLVTIIVLTYNGSSMTLDCLAAVKSFTRLPYEVILVDNGSNFKERRLLQRGLRLFTDFPLRLSQNILNIGYAAANNRAARMAHGEILVFLNNDVIVTSGWLAPLIEFLEKHKNVAACQPKLHSFIHKEYFDYAGSAGGFLDLFGYPFTRGRIFDHIEKDYGQYDTVKEISWATGACFAINNKAFFEADGFNEYFFTYSEEIDLCIRLRLRNYKIYCVPQSLVYHYGAYTSNKNLSYKIYLNHRNNMYLILKHYSLWPYLPLIACRIFFDLVAILYYMREFRFNFILALVKAYGKLVWEVPYLVKQNIISWSGRSLLANNTIYKGSIVIDYFLLGRKNFDEIVRNNDSLKLKEKRKIRKYKRYSDIVFLEKKK